jgi:hypothetical protein
LTIWNKIGTYILMGMCPCASCRCDVTDASDLPVRVPPACYLPVMPPVFGTEIKQYQLVDPDLFLFRARVGSP